MIDSERLEWITARVNDVQEAFQHPNDEDKFHALEMLEWTVQRVKAAVLADIFISAKAYPPKTSPWFGGGADDGEEANR